MAGDRARRTHSCRRAQCQCDYRHRFQILDDVFPARRHRHIGVAGILERLDRATATRAVNHADQRQAHSVRHLFALHEFAVQRCIGCPAADGEVIRAGDNRAAIDPAPPENEVGWAELGEVAMFIVAALAGDLADLPETVGIKQALQPFARIELALPVLPCELLLAPHFLRQRFTLAQMLNLSLPAHAIRIAGKRRALQARPPVVFI